LNTFLQLFAHIISFLYIAAVPEEME